MAKSSSGDSLKSRVLAIAYAKAREDPAVTEARRNAERAAYRAELTARLEAADNPGPQAIFKRMRRHGVPPIYLEALRGRYDTTAMAAATDWWATGRAKPFLLLRGGVGSGKSVAASSLVARWLERHPPNVGPTLLNPPEVAMWADARELDGLTEFKGPDILRVEAFARCGFLVLDDLSTERLSENSPAAAHVMRLLTERHQARRPTVITTNLLPAEFEKRYGARIWSRMTEGGDFRDVGDRDLRRPQRPHVVR